MRGNVGYVLNQVFEWFGEHRGGRVAVVYDTKADEWLWYQSGEGKAVLEGREVSRLVVVFQGGYWSLVKEVVKRVGRVLSEEVHDGV